MKKPLLQAVLYAVLFALNPASAMVNGSQVTEDEFAGKYPFAVVVIHKTNGGICGGTLIAPTWVLTAAHCTGMNKYVMAGSVMREGGERVDIVRAIRHPQHNKPQGQNDVGLLELSKPLDIKPVMLASVSEESAFIRSEGDATALGWGRLPSRQLAGQLMQATISMANPEYYGTLIGASSSQGPCHRDSGGPLLLVTAEGDARQFGVISATEGNLCSTDGGRAFYTRIVAITDFIRRFVTDSSGGD